MTKQEIIKQIIAYFENLPDGRYLLKNRRNITEFEDEQFFGFLKEDGFQLKCLFTEDMVSNEIAVENMGYTDFSDLECLLLELQENRIVKIKE